MRLAIADPPYLGCAHLYPEHPESHIWDDWQTHAALLDNLGDAYDGWAYACNPRDLGRVLSHVPKARVAAWCKTWHQIRPTRVQYAWEAVVFTPARAKTAEPMIRDWMSCAATTRRGTKGAKPYQWTRWVLDMLGYDADTDTVDDLFGGSGAVTAEINQQVIL